MSDKRTVARWSTPSGKWWVELYVNAMNAYTYDATNSGGCLGRLSEDEALAEMERQIRCGDFQPGRTPVQRVTLDATPPQSGYTPCACRDCMDVTVSSDVSSPELCEACIEAGCSRWRVGQGADGPASWIFECQRDDAYGEC